MNVVHINGVALLPGIDYTVTKGTISFSGAPPHGAEIILTEVVNADTGATYMTRLTGDGHTYLFKLDTSFMTRFKTQELLEDIVKYYDNPAVADLVSKLRTVIELVKEDVPVRKW